MHPKTKNKPGETDVEQHHIAGRFRRGVLSIKDLLGQDSGTNFNRQFLFAQKFIQQYVQQQHCREVLLPFLLRRYLTT